MTGIEPGQRWQFSHGGITFDIRVIDLALDGDIVHGELIAGGIPGNGPGDRVTAPTRSVRAGIRVVEG